MDWFLYVSELCHERVQGMSPEYLESCSNLVRKQNYGTKYPQLNYVKAPQSKTKTFKSTF